MFSTTSAIKFVLVKCIVTLNVLSVTDEQTGIIYISNLANYISRSLYFQVNKRKLTCTCPYIKYMFIWLCVFSSSVRLTWARDLELEKLAIKQIVEYLLQLIIQFRLRRSMLTKCITENRNHSVNWKTKIHNIMI